MTRSVIKIPDGETRIRSSLDRITGFDGVAERLAALPDAEASWLRTRLGNIAGSLIRASENPGTLFTNGSSWAEEGYEYTPELAHLRLLQFASDATSHAFSEDGKQVLKDTIRQFESAAHLPFEVMLDHLQQTKPDAELAG